jgi:hypothetical protein
MGPMGYGGFGGFGGGPRYSYAKVERPKNLKDVPRYLRELIGGFTVRLKYIFSLVWKTGPWILIFMMFIALFHGVMPVVGSLISKEILNELQTVIEQRSQGSVAVFYGSAVMLLIIFLFAYRILNRLVNTLNTALTRIAGEKVVKQVLKR